MAFSSVITFADLVCAPVYTFNTSFAIFQYWEFRHPSFTADQKHSLENIKRKITANKKPETPPGGIGAGSTSGSASAAGAASHANTSGGPAGPVGPISSLGSQQTAEEMQHLDRQIRILMGNQRQIEMHLDRFSAQYQVRLSIVSLHGQICSDDSS